jgi:hypothetical protein
VTSSAPWIIRPTPARLVPPSVLTPPAPASAWGLTTRTFYDPFTSISTIDVNNTKTGFGPGGFLWSPNGPMLSSTDTGWSGAPTLPSGAISVTGSGLSIAYGTTGGTQGLKSLFDNGNGTFTGMAFSGPFYWEVGFQINPSPASLTGLEGSPAIWMVSTQGIIGNASPFIELDNWQAYPYSAGTATSIFGNLLQWQSTGGGNFENWQANGYDGSADTNWHKAGALFIPSSLNGGTGLVQWYADGVHKSGYDVQYTSTGPASAGGGLSDSGGASGNPNGLFSVMDSESFMIILSGGYANNADWPLNVSYVAVWQA